MIKSNLILAAMALALVACATPHGSMNMHDKPKPLDRSEIDSLLGFDRAAYTPSPRCEIKVLVSATDEITVDPEVVPTRTCGNPVRLVWRLDTGTSPNYTFHPDDGISFDKGGTLPDPAKPCKVRTGGKTTECKFSQAGSGTFYVYSVTVLKDGKPLPKLDPWVFNN